MKKLEMLRKQENTRGSNDRLSELPDEVLVHILSFLPIEYAVRTMLIRRFGNLWTFIPELTFYYCSVEFISNVMKYHRNSTIDRWALLGGWQELTLEYIEKLPKWLDVALMKKPKELCIDLHTGDGWILELPHMFTSHSIVNLMLMGLHLNLPLRVDMGSLKKLELYYMEMVDEDLKVLEVGCPCLQELILYYPYGLNKVHFTSPSIERLKLEVSDSDDDYHSLDCPNLKFLHLVVDLDNFAVINVSSVRHAKIFDRSFNTRNHFEILHKKFQNAKILHLHNYCYEQLEQCSNQNLTFQLRNWSYMILKSGLRGSGCLLGIYILLRNSRFLQQLKLYFVGVDFICNCNMLLQELSSPFKMKYLKTVTILDFEKPCNTLVQLVEFLLKSAVVLEKLVIVCNKKDQLISNKGHKFILELLNLPRASKNARVVITSNSQVTKEKSEV